MQLFSEVANSLWQTQMKPETLEDEEHKKMFKWWLYSILVGGFLIIVIFAIIVEKCKGTGNPSNYQSVRDSGADHFNSEAHMVSERYSGTKYI